eukprot:7008817-Prymnesium_polylepis.1
MSRDNTGHPGTTCAALACGSLLLAGGVAILALTQGPPSSGTCMIKTCQVSPSSGLLLLASSFVADGDTETVECTLTGLDPVPSSCGLALNETVRCTSPSNGDGSCTQLHPQQQHEYVQRRRAGFALLAA